MTAFLMFLAFLVGMVVGAEFSRKLRARLAAEVDAANDRADDAEAAVLRVSRNLSDVTNDLRRAEGALAARIARDSLRGQRAAATRKAMREARELANERSDAAFDTVTDPEELPPGTVVGSLDGLDETRTDFDSMFDPPAQEAA
jgi:hypothetical protein